MHAFLVATGLVALAEIGDKTQLLALILAARFHRPWPIVAGILAATLVNHALAGAAGRWAGALLEAYLDPNWIRWGLAAGFAVMAAWALVPDKLEEGEAPKARRGASVFLATFVAFFLVEIGDKTQVATIGLAAHYPDLVAVVAGTTLGMLAANVPVVFLGPRLMKRLPIEYVRYAAASAFLLLGLALFLGWVGV
jgi:Ca2+/H+ antiporter, TMEM165/GDT1 family